MENAAVTMCFSFLLIIDPGITCAFNTHGAAADQRSNLVKLPSLSEGRKGLAQPKP